MFRISGGLIVLSVFLLTRPAQAQSQMEQLTAELEEISRGEAAEVAETEIARAREFLRLAAEAERDGRTTTAQSLLSLVPLQLRLLRELVAAARSERRADELEARLVERERARQVAREALERVLERLLALSPMWEEGRD